MVFLLSVVLIILGLLILSIKGFFGQFPDGWEWAGIILAWAGLLMGVVQMFMGRPKMLAYYRKEEDGLVILLKNVPIKSSEIWYKLGVRRDTIQSLEVSFSLQESGSKVFKQPIIHPTIYDHADTQNKNRVTLPPTFSVGVGVEIVLWDKEESAPFLVGDAQRKPLQLMAGRYSLQIAFMINGNPIKKSIDFVVGNDAKSLMWVLPNPDKEDYRIQ